MKVTYINHSSFLVEENNIDLLFDYYQPGDQIKLPKIPSQNKLFVFVSHKHSDHFDKKIFQLFKIYPDIHYILSKDLKMNENYMKRMQIPVEVKKHIFYVGKNQSYTFPELQVETLTSTDEGVAFIVKINEKMIYHAGDLNWWTWKEESEEEERKMEYRFKEEIKKIENREFDIAFLPLDPRQEERYSWGFHYFMTHTKTKLAYPMHFWNDSSVIDRIKESDCSLEYRERIADRAFYEEPLISSHCTLVTLVVS